MEKITIVLMIALLVEATWETLKMTWQQGKVSIDRVGALAVALIVCLGVDIDLLQLLGIHVTTPFLGTVLTGVLASRGSQFIHDLFEKFTGIKGAK